MFRFRTAQNNTWSFLSYCLDGFVFVILGTQLPGIIKIYTGNSFNISVLQITAGILLITLSLMLIRFIWWVTTVKRKIYSDAENPVSKIKSGLIFSIAGARGTVPLAIVFSIPLMLPDGTAFPERDLIILITAGVIIVSMLLTNFILPLLADKTADNSINNLEHFAHAEVLKTVAEKLKNEATPENMAATEIVVSHYHFRINQHPAEKQKLYKMRERQKFAQNILNWEKNVVLRMALMEQISKSSTERYIEEVDKITDGKGKKMNLLRLLVWPVQYLYRSHTMHTGKLETSYLTQDVLNVAINGFHIERMEIQRMTDEGRISPKTAKEIQANLSLLEAQLLVE
jgi:CPA1 family monovalent cation:H+ antiporter